MARLMFFSPRTQLFCYISLNICYVMKPILPNSDFDTLDDMLHATYRHILNNGSKVIGKRGAILEVNNFSVTLNDCRSRTSSSLGRRLVISKFAEFAWYLSANSNLGFIAPYIPAYQQEETNDNQVLGAYGPKIFKERDDGLSQFARVCEQLGARPDTKQAYLSLSDSSDYKTSNTKHSSPPCTIGLHFLIREEKLNVTVYMRSNDAYLGLPHDLFCFTMLQEMVAAKLGLSMGKYHHICTSLHIYEEHIDKVQSYLNEGLFDSVSMPKMDSYDKELIQVVVNAFRKEPVPDFHLENLPPFWNDFILFSSTYSKKLGNKEWLALFRTDELKSIANNSITK